MQSNAIPTFVSPLLQEAAVRFSTQIKNFTVTIDAISRDIKQLETWLQSAGVCLPFSVALDQREERHLDHDACDHLGSRPRFVTEVIAWQRCEATDTFRLTYVREVAEGEVETVAFPPGRERWFVQEGKVVEARPLIETSAETRLRALPRLPVLVEAIAHGRVAAGLPALSMMTPIDDVPF